MIITLGRRQGGKLTPGNATNDTIAKRLSSDINNLPRAVSPKYGGKREIQNPLHLQCPIQRPSSQNYYRLISATVPRRLKKAPDPKVPTPAKTPTERRAKLIKPTYTCAADTPDEINIKTLCSILSFPIGLSIYPSHPKDICDCSQGQDKSKMTLLSKTQQKYTGIIGVIPEGFFLFTINYTGIKQNLVISSNIRYNRIPTGKKYD